MREQGKRRVGKRKGREGEGERNEKAEMGMQ
jgi:hypothetical protein